MNPCQGTDAHEAVEPIIRSWSRRISRWLLNLLWTLWSLGAIILLWYTGFDAGYLGVPVDTVWPTNPTPPDPETGLRPAGNSNSWTQYIPVTVLGLCLSVLPKRPWFLSGVGQACCGLYLFGVTWFFIWVDTSNFEEPEQQYGPDCYYHSCWPADAQWYVVAAPVPLTAVAMLLMATVFRRRHWVWRMLIPIVTFLVATLVQVLVWDPWIVPWLAGPPL